MDDIVFDIAGITESIFSKHSAIKATPALVAKAAAGVVEGAAEGVEGAEGAGGAQGAEGAGKGAGGAAGAAMALLRALPLVGRLSPPPDPTRAQVQSLLLEQKAATNYRQWRAVCLKLDALLGNDAWKRDPVSDLYDHRVVAHNLAQLQRARLAKDYKLLLYLVRTTWVRNVGNMGNVNLFRHLFVGTKALIEDYIAECESALAYLCHDASVELDDRYLLGMLIQTRKNIGRTALVLLGGSTFGIFHIGVLATLLESNMLPRIVSGLLAGSIMASILCACNNEETVALLETIAERKFEIFGEEEPEAAPGAAAALGAASGLRRALKKLLHFLKYGTLFDISGLKLTMIGFVGDLTFREAYNRTGKILNITVLPALVHEQTRLLNYLTAPNCLIWLAVCALCLLPGIFPSTSIYEKNRLGQIQEWNNDALVKYVDGSVDNDLPITRLLEMFNVDHIIACQVNPHVVPFLKMLVTCVGGEIENEVSSKLKNFLSNVYDFMLSEVIHYLEVLHEAGIGLNLSTKFISILLQQYLGDITILPDFNIKDFTKIFENPTPAFLLECIVRGARALWPKLTVVRNHCGVEFALDKAITVLRGRIITDTSSKLDGRAPALKASGAGSILFLTGENPYNLVSSPVLNKGSSSPSPGGEGGGASEESVNDGDGERASPAPASQRSAPRFKRHNTINAGAFRHLPDHPKPQRNSIGASTPDVEARARNAPLNPCFPSVNKARGKSTTSLTGLKSAHANHHFASRASQKRLGVERSPSPPRPVVFLHGRSKSLYSPEAGEEGLIDDVVGESEGAEALSEGESESERGYRPYRNNDLVGLGMRASRTMGFEHEEHEAEETERRVRKARSSGNFALAPESDHGGTPRQLRYEMERIPYHKENPYLDGAESPREFALPTTAATLPTLKANLPSKRALASNSLRNSYVGLNRLKERGFGSSHDLQTPPAYEEHAP